MKIFEVLTSPNGLYALRRLTAARATKKRSLACALCAFLLRHIFAVAGTLRVPLSQPQNRRIQPERYTTYPKNPIISFFAPCSLLSVTHYLLSVTCSPIPTQNLSAEFLDCSNPISFNRRVKNLSLTACSLFSTHQSA